MTVEPIPVPVDIVNSNIAASIFLPSYNKKAFVLDAIHSVLDQTSADWELWLVENSTDGETRNIIEQSGVLADPRIIYEKIDLDPELRASVYPTTWLMNRYYPKANGRYIFYLSDDDLFGRECVQTCVSHMDEHVHHHVVYFSQAVVDVESPGAEGRQTGVVPATSIRGAGMVDCQIDGGQVVHRKACLKTLKQPFFSEVPQNYHARHSDGVFLESLAAHYLFYPITAVLGTHRYTPVSAWTYYHHGVRSPRWP
jgi:spore maturation protein CgeD